MFSEPTTFILGAGASWHYGYPTGETLVEEVLKKSRQAHEYFKMFQSVVFVPQYLRDKAQLNDITDMREVWKSALEECADFQRRLRDVNPPVIDYFLGLNPHLEKIGKLLIAWVLLEREKESSQTAGNINRPKEERQIAKDDWLRFVLSHIAAHCECSSELLANDVRFVTFNYDTSLERHLWNGLRSMSRFDEEDVQTFMSNDRVIHMYGRLSEPSGEDYALEMLPYKAPFVRRSEYGQNKTLEHQDWIKFLDVVYSASKGIRTIAPNEKDLDQAMRENASACILRARTLYILGFGFDQQNCDRLCLSDIFLQQDISHTDKFVYFSNLDDRNTVNKIASRIFFGHSTALLPGTFFQKHHSVTYEKSIRNCYDAISLDFGLF